MASTWLKLSFACLILAQCVLSDAAAAEKRTTPKPSAHVVVPYLEFVSYRPNAVMKDWTISEPMGHLEGGMQYEDGKLIVPQAGRFYIYTQLFFTSAGRVRIMLNNDYASFIISPVAQEGVGATVNGMGVFVLNAGDTISLQINPWGAPDDGLVKFWMDYASCYFGAFLI